MEIEISLKYSTPVQQWISHSVKAWRLENPTEVSDMMEKFVNYNSFKVQRLSQNHRSHHHHHPSWKKKKRTASSPWFSPCPPFASCSLSSPPRHGRSAQRGCYRSCHWRLLQRPHPTLGTASTPWQTGFRMTTNKGWERQGLSSLILNSDVVVSSNDSPWICIN